MGKKKILVVEDEFITASDIQATLNGMGFEVPAIVDTGEDAVKMAGELRPDAILMDISLKGKMNGIEAASIIKDRYGIPVIYLTGQSDDATINKALEAEPFGYIIKPFEEKTLKATIGMALYKHAIDESLRESEHLVRSLINANPEPMFILDAKTKVLVINEAYACKPADPSRAPGEQTLDTLVSDGVISKKLADAVRAHFYDKKPSSSTRSSGGKWVGHSIIPLTIPAGRDRPVRREQQGCHRDETGRREAEDPERAAPEGAEGPRRLQGDARRHGRHPHLHHRHGGHLLRERGLPETVRVYP